MTTLTDSSYEDDGDSDVETEWGSYHDATAALTKAELLALLYCTLFSLDASQHFSWHDVTPADVAAVIDPKSTGAKVLATPGELGLSTDEFMTAIASFIVTKMRAEDEAMWLAAEYAEDVDLLDPGAINDDYVDDFISEASERYSELREVRMTSPILFGDICSETLRQLQELQSRAELRLSLQP